MDTLRTLCLALGASCILAGSAIAEPITESVPTARGEVRWSEGTVLATGTGLRPKDADSAAQATLLARSAALADAYRNLARVIYDVHVTATTTVERQLTTSDSVRLNIEGYIRGAQVVEERDGNDGSYRVTLQAPLAGRNGLAGIVLPGVLNGPRVSGGVEAIPASKAVPAQTGGPTPTPAAPETPATLNLEPELLTAAKDDGPFTGVIIDARGLKMQPAMSPRLFDPALKEVYGTVNVDASFAEEVGVVGYMGTVKAALGLERVGKHPLVIRAAGICDPHRRYATISAEDADRILKANDKAHFLEKCAVVLVIDERRSRDEGH